MPVMTPLRRILLMFLLCMGTALADDTARSEALIHGDNERLQQLLALEWDVAMHDAGTKDWQDRWFLDGTRAAVTNTPDGMILTAGPIPRDHASHCVLWTKDSFAGDVKIEFDYWRLDTIQRWVNILYIQATGTGVAPYDKDIDAWSQQREIPYMKSYFNHMNLLHISFAAFDPDSAHDDYVRMRRYPTSADRSFSELAVRPDYFDTGLFRPGVKHHFTVIKRHSEVHMRISDGEKTMTFSWDTSRFDPIVEGRIGFRHMFTRSARYADISISTLSRRRP
jgi:hypothetical protein